MYMHEFINSINRLATHLIPAETRLTSGKLKIIINSQHVIIQLHPGGTNIKVVANFWVKVERVRRLRTNVLRTVQS